MTLKVWRICHSRHRDTIWSGKGAFLAGGRWNSQGVGHICYTSESEALCRWECLVHAPNLDTVSGWVCAEAEFPEDLVAEIHPSTLSTNWKDYPAPPVLASLGDDWVQKQTSAILRVPSAVVDNGWNYLLNVQHPDFDKIRIGPALEINVIRLTEAIQKLTITMPSVS